MVQNPLAITRDCSRVNDDLEQQGSLNPMTLNKNDSRRWMDWIRWLWRMLTRSGDDHPWAVFMTAAGVGILMMIYTTQRAHLDFHHDSQYYWDLGGSFIANNQFSFRNYSDGLRGYLFPFLLFIVQGKASLLGLDARLLFAVYSALFFTVFSIYLVHWFFEGVFGWKAGIANRLAFAFLLFFFWRGYFLYPLTDFPSLAAVLASMILVTRATETRYRGVLLFLAGFFAGAALNIRPIYQISVPVILICMSYLQRRHGFGTIVPSAVLFILGGAAVLIPQVIVNKARHNSISPLVLAQYVGDANIYEVQLFWGLKTQKYETNIGDNYPWAGVVYSDPLALDLPRGAMQERTIVNYLGIVAQNPLGVLISYFRHTFNGLDIFFPTPYVRNIFAGHVFFSLLNYIIWFMFFQPLPGIRAQVFGLGSMLGAAVLVMPVVLSIPTVVEVRFFLPAYILAYGVASRGFPVNELIAQFSENPWRLLRLSVLCSTWILLCFTLSAATIEHLAV